MRFTDRGRIDARGRIESDTWRGTGQLVGTTGRLIGPGYPLNYNQQYGLIYYHDPSQGITFGGTLLASGTTPPAVTISGTCPYQIGLRLRCSTGGILGTAKFDWSTDNGTTYPGPQSGITTAASVALGTTGITAAFPAGTYDVNNVWRAVVSSHADVGARAIHMLQTAPSLQPEFLIAGINGRPVLSYGAAGSTILESASFTSVAQPCTRFFVAKDSTGTGTQVIMDSRADPRQYMYQNSNTDLGIGTTAAGFNPTYTNGTTARIWTAIFNGASSELKIDGVSVGTGTLGSNGFDILRYGDYYGAGVPFVGYMGESFGFASLVATVDQADMVSRLKQIYGIA